MSRSDDAWLRFLVPSVATVMIVVALAGLLGGGGDSYDLPVLAAPVRDCDAVGRFPSEVALVSALRPPPAASQGGWGWGTGMLTGPGSGPSTGTATTDAFSGTNNQVDGVDEADIVKTDGRRIYTASRGGVTILEAYPPEEARVLSRIPVPAGVAGLFIDGDRLVVLATPGGSPASSSSRYAGPTSLRVYDLTDPRAPALERSVTVSGGYIGARMADGHVYLVASDLAYASKSRPVLPWISVDGARRSVSYQDIGVLDNPGGPGTIVTVLGVALRGAAFPALEAFLTRGSQQLYVSPGNVYVAGAEGGAWASSIHRVSISEGRVAYSCSVRVPGWILNQFSMDEHEGYLRVATTVGHAWGGESRNNVYVLNATLNETGRLEGVAPGEVIHSARFMGDRAYLVTFKKVDPFFVIDLSDPAAPAVLGYLKIPGYSDYLHPYDETHVLGLGKDTHDMGDFAWYQGLKLSLFDVADVEHPAEVATIRIGDRGTWSEALFDHKAFLFMASRNLVVVPVHLFLIDLAKYPGGAPPETFGDFVWQGAYVISITPEGGFEVRAKIAHAASFGAGSTWASASYYGPLDVRRSLYIENVLYTVSQSLARAHSLDTFEEVATVDL